MLGDDSIDLAAREPHEHHVFLMPATASASLDDELRVETHLEPLHPPMEVRPVTLPVEPTRPICSPWRRCWPGVTSMRERCA